MSEEFNPEALGEILEIDVETYIEVIDCYTEDTPSILSELQEALSSNDASTLRERAHKLKGSSSTMGLSKVSELAMQIELIAKNGSCAGCDTLAAELETAVQNAYAWLAELKQKAAS